MIQKFSLKPKMHLIKWDELIVNCVVDIDDEMPGFCVYSMKKIQGIRTPVIHEWGMAANENNKIR